MKNKLKNSINIYQNKITDNYLQVELYFDIKHRIIIKNYCEIKKIEDNNIIIDNIEILGNNLLIVSLDDYQVHIQGILKEVIYLER